MEIHRLADNCDYGAMKEEMIRDRLVVGIRDSRLSETLQLDAKLTLGGAKEKIRQLEAVREQQLELKEGENNSSLYEVKFRQGRPYNKLSTQKGGRNRAFQIGRTCTRCEEKKCPAREGICHNCQRKGHYGSQCFSKNMSEIATTESDAEGSIWDTAFLDTVSNSGEKTWLISIKVQNIDVKFKLDTGAEVTAISEETFQLLKIVYSVTQRKTFMVHPDSPLKYWEKLKEGKLAYRQQINDSTCLCCEQAQNESSGLTIGSNCPGISGTVPDLLTLSLVPEGLPICPGRSLISS